MYDNGYQYGQEGEWLGELLALPVDPLYHEPVTAVQFDHQYEAIWAGTESGMLYTLQSPMLTRYASWAAHQSSVLDLLVLSDCGVSVSSSRVVINTHGGFTRAAANLTDQADGWVSAVVEPGTGSGRLLLAGSSGQLYTHDLITNKVTLQAEGPVAGDGFTHLCGPVGHHGAVAAATAAGRVLLIDSRTTWQVTSTTIAHSGGISALDVRGDLMATCGYSRHMGTLVDDNCIKVFDCRSALQPLYQVSCGCPGMLCWHPMSSSTLLVASQSGMFMITDPSNPATMEQYQVDTAGDSLRCAALSPSGECIVFGGGGGYCHLWSASMTPRATARSRTVQLLTQPHKQSKKTVISESSPFSAAPSPQSLLLVSARAAGATSAAAAAAAAASTRLLSDVPDMLVVNTGKPPRVVDESLKQEIKQVDFIGYIPNPHYSRGKAPGAARKAALLLQHKRIALKVEQGSADVKSSKQRRIPESGTLLPRRYRRLVIKAQSSMRFEEFDFTYYNKTKFAGLENDLPNCYCNALLQVFYFTPAFRAAILQHKPEPSLEFCLTCELLFLFKMLLNAAGGLPCQALNLLRALRQNREAAALGLLEGTVAAGGNSQGLGLGPEGGLAGGTGSGLGFGKAGAYDGVNPNPNAKPYDGGGGGGAKAREWGSSAANLAVKSGLPKRVVTLCRFLLDHLYKEAGGDSAATADSSSSSTADPSSAASGETSYAAAAAAAAAATPQMPAALSHLVFKQNSRPLKKSKRGTADGSSADQQQQQQQQDLAKVIQELFGLCYRSDMTALTGPKKGSSKSRQLKTFQVDLIYPPVSKDTHGSSSSSKTPTSAAASPSPAGSPLLAGVSPSAASPSSPLRAHSPGLSGLPGLSLGPRAVADRPGFGSLLANSLTCEGVTKAWFDESGGYAYVKQSRVPLELPKVLVINCAITHPSQVALWEPVKTPAAAAAAAASDPAAAAAGSTAPQQQQQHERPWLPWVLQVRSDPVSADVDVITADTVDELEDITQGVSPAAVQATYELTALICQITDEAESEQASSAAAAAAKRGAGGLPGSLASMSPGAAAAAAGSRTPGGSSSSSPGGVYQGHVVALIRVQPPYLDPNLVGGLHRFPSAVDQLKSQGSGITLAAAAGSSGSGAAATLSRRLSSGSGGALIRGLSGGSGPKRAGSGTAAAAPAAEFMLPDNLGDVFAELAIPADTGGLDSSTAAAADQEDLSEQQQQQQSPDGSSSIVALSAVAAAAGSVPSGSSILRSSSGSKQQLPSTATAAHDGSSQQWVVINDFSISSIPPSEVLNLYNGQKLPCLVFYTQVSEVASSCQLSPPEPPSPVDAATFQTLCTAPPLQGASWRGRRNFVPLEFPREAPRPGFMVAIDAEFVAVTRAETSFEGGVEVQLKPSRLALARVSVLRGQGSQAGTAFIDDYVMSVEPVVDYLTRWSGIKPGDLDPSTSQHYLVSLKTAYLKLHHLLDAGCVFIGHGLKQDFRMLNINVPPEQVRDTVELFSFRRQRKLSLRFLASYLLGLSIQTGAGPSGAAAAAAAAAATSTSRSVLDTGAAAAAAAVPVVRGGVVGSSAVGGGYQGHDSIEDAATALALYNVYCKLKLESRLEEKLHEMYRWGKTYGWEPVVHVNGVPQPPSPSAAAVGTPVK